MSPLLLLQAWQELVLNLFFPRICVGCGWEGAWLCGECRKVSPQIILREDGVLSLFDFEQKIVREMLHHLKYNGISEIAEVAVQLLAEHFKPHQLLGQLGLVEPILIPVPVTRAKLKQRGYSQAEEIALALARWLKVPVWPGALQRSGRAISQVGKGAADRRIHVKGVFKIGFSSVPEQYVRKEWLVIDDVVTTGSTLAECLAVLSTYHPRVKALALASVK